jgi:hypothetical protein
VTQHVEVAVDRDPLWVVLVRAGTLGESGPKSVVPVVVIDRLASGTREHKRTLRAQPVCTFNCSIQLSMSGGFATQAHTNVKALQATNEYSAKLGKHLFFQRNPESGVYGRSAR